MTPVQRTHPATYGNLLLAGLLTSACSSFACQEDPDLPPVELRLYVDKALQMIADTTISETTLDSLRSRAHPALAHLRTHADCHALIRSLLRDLGDNHSFLLSPEESTADQRGDIPAGTGILTLPSTPTVAQVFPHSPADRARVSQGDLLLSVNHTPTAGRWDRSMVREVILGNHGRPVHVTLMQVNGTVRDVILTPEPLHVSMPPHGHLVGHSIGYIELPGGTGAAMLTEYAQAAHSLMHRFSELNRTGFVGDSIS